ncbi:unnamed protein product, partial [Amoebophrya sp. A120]
GKDDEQETAARKNHTEAAGTGSNTGAGAPPAQQQHPREEAEKTSQSRSTSGTSGAQNNRQHAGDPLDKIDQTPSGCCATGSDSTGAAGPTSPPPAPEQQSNHEEAPSSLVDNIAGLCDQLAQVCIRNAPIEDESPALVMDPIVHLGKTASRAEDVVANTNASAEQQASRSRSASKTTSGGAPLQYAGGGPPGKINQTAAQHHHDPQLPPLSSSDPTLMTTTGAASPDLFAPEWEQEEEQGRPLWSRAMSDEILQMRSRSSCRQQPADGRGRPPTGEVASNVDPELLQQEEEDPLEAAMARTLWHRSVSDRPATSTGALEADSKTGGLHLTSNYKELLKTMQMDYKINTPAKVPSRVAADPLYNFGTGRAGVVARTESGGR